MRPDTVDEYRRWSDLYVIIRPGEDQMYIDPRICIDCGACEPECPVEAIFEAEQAPEPWKDYIKKNADFFRKRLSGQATGKG